MFKQTSFAYVLSVVMWYVNYLLDPSLYIQGFQKTVKILKLDTVLTNVSNVCCFNEGLDDICEKMCRRVPITRIFKLNTHWSFWYLILILFLVVPTEPFTDERMTSIAKHEYLFKIDHWTPSSCAAQCREKLAGNGSLIPKVAITAYYQITPRKYVSLLDIVIIVDAILCLIPLLLWKIMEDGFFEKLLLKLESLRKTSANKSGEMMAAEIRQNFDYHYAYVVKFFFCELISSLISIVQFYAIIPILKGKFHDVENILLFFLCIQDASAFEKSKISHELVICKAIHSEPQISVGCRFPSVVPINDLLSLMYASMYLWHVMLAFTVLLDNLLWLVRIYFPNFYILYFTESCQILRSSELRALACKAEPGEWLIILNLQKKMPRKEFVDFIDALATTNYEQPAENA